MILPKMYFYRGRERSDRDYIEKRMALIPEVKQQEVADRYEQLYLADGPAGSRDSRKNANEYINDLAKRYYSGELKVTEEDDGLTDYERHKAQMVQAEKVTRKKDNQPVPAPGAIKKQVYTGPSIIEMAEQARKGK